MVWLLTAMIIICFTPTSGDLIGLKHSTVEKTQCDYHPIYFPSNTEIHISCDTGVIEVSHVNFGRTQPGSVLCPLTSLDSNTDCLMDMTADYQADCDGLTSCTVDITPYVDLDPCEWTYKYINCTYMCVTQMDMYFQNVPGRIDTICPELSVHPVRGHTKVKYILPEAVTTGLTVIVDNANIVEDTSAVKVYTNVHPMALSDFVGMFYMCSSTVNEDRVEYQCDCTWYTCEAVFLALWHHSPTINLCDVTIVYQ